MVLTPEQIRGIAQQKKSYNPNVNGAKLRPVAGSRQTRTRPVPPVGGTGTGRSPVTSVGIPDPLGIVGNNNIQTGDNSVGDSIKGLFGDAVGGFLKVIDIPRAGYQNVAADVGDVVNDVVPDAIQPIANVVAGNPFQLRNPENEDDVSFVDAIRNPNQQVGARELMPWIDQMPDDWQKTAAGFVGDVAADPTTYLSAGAGGALKGSGRVALTETVVRNAGKEGLEEAGKALAEQTARRGAGALTKKGLAKAGVTVDEAAALTGRTARQLKGGIRIGPMQEGLRVPGTRIVSDAVENSKGAIKEAFGRSGLGRGSDLFRTADFGERALRRAVISGDGDVFSKTQALIRINDAKRASYGWIEGAANQLADLEGIRTLSKNERRALTFALDTGNVDGLSASVREWFDTTARTLQDAGVDFAYRQNYVPHRLTPQARRAARGGDTTVTKFVDTALDKTERFQAVREDLVGTIEEINDQWRRGAGQFSEVGPHNFDLLETDFNVLAEHYLSEAQRAMMTGSLRAIDGKLVTDLTPKVADDLVEADIKTATQAGDQAARQAVKDRREAAKLGVQVAEENRTVAARTVRQAEQAQSKAADKVADLTGRAETLKVELEALDGAVRTQEAIVARARGAEKGRATQRLNKLVAERDQAARRWEDISEAVDRQVQNRGNRNALADAQAEYDAADALVADAVEIKRATDAAAQDGNVLELQKQAARVADKATRVRQQFIDMDAQAEEAANAATWLAVDNQAKIQRATKMIEQIDEYVASLKGVKGKNFATKSEEARELRERLVGFRAMFDSGDKRLSDMAALEASAAAHDMAVLMSGRKVSQLRNINNMLGNKNFQKYVTLQTDQGFSRLKEIPENATDIERAAADAAGQAADWYKEAIETTRHLMDPKLAGPAWKAASYAMDGYMKAYNWWKGFATGTPGFVVRNVYSGLFNMYLDGVAPRAITRYGAFHTRFERDGLEAAQAWATRKYGPTAAQQLTQAFETSAASGWGQTFSVAAPQTLRVQNAIGSPSKGFGPSAVNPVSTRNVLTGSVREASNSAEAVMRGAHAYHVIRQTGSTDEALARVEKFHFNYRDVSEMDRAIKTVSPFFVFFSRNLALQAQVFAQKPFKLNRSYFNFKRNMEWGSEDDPDAPDWLAGPLGGMRTTVGDVDGTGRMYLTPDIPSIAALEQFADPVAALTGALGPGVKTPVQLISNTDMFTGRQYKNRLDTYGPDGEPIPRLAPNMLQAPGVRDLVGLLPGADVYNDQLLMQDNVQSALESFIPQLGQTNRLAPNMPTGEMRQSQSIINYLGGPVRWNDPVTQSGVQYGRETEQQSAAQQAAYRALLDELTGGG